MPPLVMRPSSLKRNEQIKRLLSLLESGPSKNAVREVSAQVALGRKYHPLDQPNHVADCGPSVKFRAKLETIR